MCFAAILPVIAEAAAGASGLAGSVGTFLGANSTAIGLLGAGVSAYGSYQQAQGQKQAANYNAAVADANAKTAEFAAQDAKDRAEQRAIMVGQKVADVRGRQRAALAANGLDLSYGNAAGIQETTDYYGSQDQRTERDNGEREAYSLRSQSSNFSNEATMNRSRADNISPFGAAATSFLGSATSIAGKWYDKQPSSSGSIWDNVTSRSSRDFDYKMSY